jgi:hypothetical protein
VVGVVLWVAVGSVVLVGVDVCVVVVSAGVEATVEDAFTPPMGVTVGARGSFSTPP